VMGADWGSGSISMKDVRLGGWIGLAFAPAIVASLALIAVAGYQGMKESSNPFAESPMNRTTITELPARGQVTAPPVPAGLDAPPYTMRLLLNGRFDPRIGGLILMTFGLASLAPAVYSSFMFGQQFKAIGPGISKLTWTMLGTCTAWLLIVGGWFDRTEVAFNLLGAAFAPVAGAMTADYRRHRGRWPGPRAGANPAGLLAWGVGLVVGLAPTIGRAFKSDRLQAVEPAALWAFVAAYLTYEVLALVRLESARDSEPPGEAVPA
jgi:cytosine permease